MEERARKLETQDERLKNDDSYEDSLDPELMKDEFSFD